MFLTSNIALQQESERVTSIVEQAFRDSWEEALSQTPKILAALMVFAIFLVAGLIIRQALKTALRRITMAPRIRLLILRLVFIAVLALGGIIFLSIVSDVSLGQVIAGFGLLSVGLGFALKSPLENMLSGVLTILFAPFRIGDEIEVQKYRGRVETISIHDTIIRTFDGKKVAVPNSDIYLNAITNRTAYPQRRYDVVVGIHYEDDLRKALKVAREVLTLTQGVHSSPEPLVLVSKLSDFSVDLILRFWSDPTMQAQFQVISNVTASIKVAFDAEGITIPFPIRTLHVPQGEAKGAGELQVRIADKTTNPDGRNGSTNTGEEA